MLPGAKRGPPTSELSPPNWRSINGSSRVLASAAARNHRPPPAGWRRSQRIKLSRTRAADVDQGAIRSGRAERERAPGRRGLRGAVVLPSDDGRARDAEL